MIRHVGHHYSAGCHVAVRWQQAQNIRSGKACEERSRSVPRCVLWPFALLSITLIGIVNVKLAILPVENGHGPLPIICQYRHDKESSTFHSTSNLYTVLLVVVRREPAAFQMHSEPWKCLLSIRHFG